MGGDEALIAIGVGCRKGCPAAEIVGLVREALAVLARAEGVAGLFSIALKADEPGLAEAAATLGLPLTFLDKDALGRFADAAVTRSPRIEAMHSLPSVAETAALAGAGDGAVLLVSRMTTPRATCAIAGPAREDAPLDEADRDLPSPLAGEGARRADEGSSQSEALPEAPLIRRFAPPSPARGEGSR